MYLANRREVQDPLHLGESVKVRPSKRFQKTVCLTFAAPEPLLMGMNRVVSGGRRPAVGSSVIKITPVVRHLGLLGPVSCVSTP